MPRIELFDAIDSLADFDLDQLEELDRALQLTLRIRRQSEISTDLGSKNRMEKSSEPTLADLARDVLADLDSEHEFTLADQALLAAVILSEHYSQATFSSRDINDTITEAGRPRVAHITSALAGLTQRSYLVGSTKELSLSPEGKSKARGLIDMIQRPGPGKAA